MNLRLMREKGIPLPPIETEDGLTAKDIMDKVRSFYIKSEKYDGESAEYIEGYFMELLFNYPKSMCSRDMTESLKQLIALIYFESKPTEEERKQSQEEHEKWKIKQDVWPGYSYEDLGVMFDRSKATIHEAIRQKETEAKRLIEEARLRTEAKKIALEDYVKEEKEKLKLEQNNQRNQPNERTNAHNQGGEVI